MKRLVTVIATATCALALTLGGAAWATSGSSTTHVDHIAGGTGLCC
ncbi:hypothetical protein [Kitasatospora viridis]|uniref:Small secreted domain DUF320 n=1 Tax=Kitasatospora viridis TaxID=281105 RepID=A0A561ULB2_9ACTN|nr:hypothetical protein [Kitasatospora viridis]TWG00156.1 hypothetical protein FHX73_114025 [Kitasatospora viridis]